MLNPAFSRNTRNSNTSPLHWHCKFCRDGLQGLEQDDDMLTAMARELVTDKGIGESAAAVWRQIQAEHVNIVKSTAIDPALVSSIEDEPTTTPLNAAGSDQPGSCQRLEVRGPATSGPEPPTGGTFART